MTSSPRVSPTKPATGASPIGSSAERTAAGAPPSGLRATLPASVAPPTGLLSERPEWTAELTLLGVVLIWGTNFVLLKAILPAMPAHVMNAFRMAFSVAALGVFVRLRLGRVLLPALREAPWRVIGLGLLSAMYMAAFIAGLDRTKAGSAALIMASAPMWTALLAFALRYERLLPVAWAGIFLSMLGTAAVVLGGDAAVGFGSDEFAGNAIMVLAALLWGSYTAFTRPMVARVPAMALAFYAACVALPVLALVAVPYVPEVHWDRATLLVWGAILLSGTLSTGLAVGMWNEAVRRIGPTNTAAFSNLVPFFALLTGVLFLGEPVTVWQVVGGTFILGGLLLARRGRLAAHRSA